LREASIKLAYSLLLPFDASGVVLFVLARLRVAVRRAGVDDADDLNVVEVDGLAGNCRGVLALGVRGPVVVFLGVVVTPGVVSPLA
jgi:hypothetical protein